MKRGRLTKGRLAAAFVVAVVSDVVGIVVELVPPLQWGVDVVTAVVLFVILGARWQLLPALVAEAIPGVGVMPFWVLTVAMVWRGEGNAGKGSRDLGIEGSSRGEGEKKYTEVANGVEERGGKRGEGGRD